MKIKIFLSLVLFLSVSINCKLASAEPKWYHGAEKLDRNIAHVIGKAPNCIVVQTNHGLDIESRYIMVEFASRFYDVDGSLLSLAALKIPCLAEVKVTRRENTPDAGLMELKVLEYDDDASPGFTMTKPFKRLPR